MRLLVIADDLTGACETGAKFASMGLDAEVSIDVERAEDLARSTAGVLVLDTESRHVSPAEAAYRVDRLVRGARESGIERFYMKTDSTLRGNVGAELEALMRAAGVRRLPFVPAYPAAGRSTRNGCQYVHGKPLHETSFANDPLEPIESSSIPEIIARQSSVKAIVIGRQELDRLSELAQVDECICIFDAENDQDLDRIAVSLEEHGLLRCCAGAAGFAQRVAGRLSPGARPSAAPSRRGPVLFVNGSLQETALGQIRCGIEEGIESVKLEPEVLFAQSLSQPPARALTDSACGALQAGRDVLLHTVTHFGQHERYVQCAKQRHVGDPCLAAADALGTVTAAIVRRCESLGAVVAFGGDTAVAVLRALGLTALRLRQELWPGVIESSVRIEGRDMPFITKSGGFGPEDLMSQLSSMFAPREA